MCMQMKGQAIKVDNWKQNRVDSEQPPTHVIKFMKHDAAVYNVRYRLAVA